MPVLSALPCAAQVIASDWNAGSGNWNVPANWAPADVPDNGGTFTYNVQIGNLAPAAAAQVSFIPEDGTSDTISTLSLLGTADLFTNGGQLVVTGQTTLGAAGNVLRVDAHATPSTVAFSSLNLDVNGGSTLTVNGGRLSVTDQLEINAGSTLFGYGTIDLGNADAVIEQAFENSGLIQVIGTSSTPGLLTLHGNAVDTIDLDGDSELGVVDVSNAAADLELDTLTLIVDGPLADGFGALAPGAQLLVGQRDTVTFNDSFQIDTGAIITMDGGTNLARINGAGAMTDIAGAAFTITGAAEIDNDMTFTGTANTIAVNAASSLRLDGNVDMADASALSLTSTSEWIVGGDVVVSEAAGDFNWDGPGVASTTIDGTGQLSFFVNRIDTTDDIYGGTLNLEDSGDLLVDNVANDWTLAGTLNKNGAGTSLVAGDAMLVTGNINVNGGILDLPVVTLQSGADVVTNAELRLGGGSVLAGPVTLSGSGLLRMDGTSTVSATTTVNVANFDWDGSGSGTAHTINHATVFTVNSTVWDADDSGDVDDNINLGGNGAQLVVNGVPTWTMARSLNANTALAGTATIGGTSRLILEGPSAVLNVDGNTSVTSPITFGTSSFTTVDAGMVLEVGPTATYHGGTVTGPGTFQAATLANLVTSGATISVSNFDFDAGSWNIQDGALLSVNVTDYDPGVVTNAFDQIIHLNNADISVATGDAEFVMDDTINMSSTLPAEVTQWSGEPLDIGNDIGALDANLNVTGTAISRIATLVDFNSDADVNVAGGATLDLGSIVNFDTVNAANNAEFTGTGILSFSQQVNVNEAVTLNMSGGTVDLDGLDSTGDFVNIDAPLTVNAAVMSSFGRTNAAGINTLDINNSVGTGILTVNLDSPTQEWTVNPQGVMQLVNDNSNATLLAGNDLNLNGTVEVTGNVGIDCRVDIGGTINIYTAGQLFRLAGGVGGASPNRILGGMINGPGAISAPDGRELRGFGTINAPVDFDGWGALRADDGSLTVTGSILDVGTIGTANDTGFLNVTNAWNTNVALSVILNGGELQGGAITISNPGGIRGKGLVSSRIINDTRIQADSDTLVFKTPANNNDWDGVANNAQIVAAPGGTLELHDDAPVTFAGTIIADHGRVYAKGFGITLTGGMSLLGGIFETDESTTVEGSVASNAGGDSIFKVQNNRFLTFTPTSQATLISNLHLQNNNIDIEAGASFSGAGSLIIDEGSHAVADNGAVIDVLVDVRGDFRPGGFDTIGRVDMRDFQQGPDSTLHFEFTGTGLNQFDRLVVDGAAQLAGRLEVDIDGGFVPVAGQTFDIISAPGGISGQFDGVEISGLPAGLTPVVTYLPTLARVTMVTGTQYEIWIQSFAALTLPADRLKTADPDKDGFDNLTEFALNGNPTLPKGIDKVFAKIAPVGGENALTLTVPIRVQTSVIDVTAGFDLLDISATFQYSILASDTLLTFPLAVTEVTGADADGIQAGLPAIDPGWEYRTFRSPGPVAGDAREFMRVVVEAL